MSMKEHFSYLSSTPQSRPILGREDEMLKNDAGGYVFRIPAAKYLERFLALGTDGGTYYVNEKKHTIRNFSWIIKYLKDNPRAVLELTARMSEEGRLLRNKTAVAVLVLAWENGARKLVPTVFNRIVRIPTDLFMFLSFLKEAQGGKISWNRALRDMIADWYYSNQNLVYHILKYQSREGWSHRDVLRTVHIKPVDDFMDQLFGFVVGNGKHPEHPLVEAFVRLRNATSESEVVTIIKEFRVTWEFIPTQWLNSKLVWEALLDNLPYTALVRNLPKLSSIGVDGSRIASKLLNFEQLKRSKVHPMRLGFALKFYQKGRNKNMTWHVDRKVLEAIEDAFITSFNYVEPIGKKMLVAVDGSGSMTWHDDRMAMLPIEAATLIAWPLVVAEPDSELIGFDTEVWQVPVTKRSNWNSIMESFGHGGGTDAALPFEYASKNHRDYDVFIIITDNETWRGDEHPVQALQKYRKRVNPHAKLVVISMTATRASIVDPKDPDQLDIVGFDASIAKVISTFAAT